MCFQPGLASKLFFASTLIITGALFAPKAAQSQVTITTEGVDGDIDKERRSPSVSVTTQHIEGGVKLLVDAYIPHREFEKYPIQFDFFINRMLFTTQYRSTTLPGAVGVDIGPDIATPPFNYTVVAKVLHPNRTFTTVAEGAVFTSNLSTTLDCTLTREVADPDSTEAETITELFTGDSVTIAQPSDNQINLEFDADDESGETSITVAASATIAEEEADSTGSIIITEEDDSTSTVTGSATVERTDGTLTAVTVTSEDGETVLSCS